MRNFDYSPGERVTWYKDLNRFRCNKVTAVYLGISPAGRARIAVVSDTAKDGLRKVSVDFDNIEKIKGFTNDKQL